MSTDLSYPIPMQFNIRRFGWGATYQLCDIELRTNERWDAEWTGDDEVATGKLKDIRDVVGDMSVPIEDVLPERAVERIQHIVLGTHSSERTFRSQFMMRFGLHRCTYRLVEVTPFDIEQHYDEVSRLDYPRDETAKRTVFRIRDAADESTVDVCADAIVAAVRNIALGITGDNDE